ncbi:hypothetical protein H2200_003172 [Cladophialophora chaetospira]|uniref:Uncharacterized protein n=1 Tax=Cladophialophora chaetospira TaxID=386627 RepID=A0AA38XGU8_9EURO|nr:hypothetical protein H2200_003172 [Cladophialophora chaetospira]
MPQGSLRSNWDELLGVAESQSADRNLLAGRLKHCLHTHPHGPVNANDEDIHELAVAFLNSDDAKSVLQKTTATGLNLDRNYHHILIRIKRILRVHQKIKRRGPRKRRSLTVESDFSDEDLGSSVFLDRPRRRTRVTHSDYMPGSSIDSVNEAVPSREQDDEVPETDDTEGTSEWQPSRESTVGLSSKINGPNLNKRTASVFESSPPPPAKRVVPEQIKRATEKEEVLPAERHLASHIRPHPQRQQVIPETPLFPQRSVNGPPLSVPLPHLRGKAWKFESAEKMAALLASTLAEVERTLEKQARKAQAESERAYLAQRMNNLEVHECVDNLLKKGGADLVDRPSYRTAQS